MTAETSKTLRNTVKIIEIRACNPRFKDYPNLLNLRNKLAVSWCKHVIFELVTPQSSNPYRSIFIMPDSLRPDYKISDPDTDRRYKALSEEFNGNILLERETDHALARLVRLGCARALRAIR